MKTSERIAVIKRISSELNDRYDHQEVSVFLRAFIPRFRADYDDYVSVGELSRYALSDVEESVLGEIVDDLGIEALGAIASAVQPPTIWHDESRLRVFISHLSLEKKKAMRLRDTLSPHGISAFVAHEDIAPTLEWQVQIERALHSMELFISMHTLGFKDSFWTQQEIGFAVAKGVKVIALRMGEDPVGFISKHQALSRGEKTAEVLAQEIDKLLIKDQRLSERYRECKDAATNDVPF